MLEFIGDANIQVTIVSAIRCACKSADNVIALIHNQSRWRVEYRLPVVVDRKRSKLETKNQKWITTDFQCV
jgi:hypothetical protein